MEIDQLYKEFRALKSYHDKLKFFDQHFTLLPFDFPTFDVQLHFLLQEDVVKLLTEILEKERRKSYSFIKRSYFADTDFVFDVHPHNSNMQVFNDYVISKFIYDNDHLLRNSTSVPGSKDLESRIIEVNSLIADVKHRIENKKDRTFRKQFFTVFYSGFLDYTNSQTKKYSYKKKFIELYLYSMGIVFGKYKEALLEQLYKTEIKAGHASSDSTGNNVFLAKVQLLNELGVTQFLREKYKDSGELNIEKKIAELYCTITGENGRLIKNTINSALKS